MAEGLNVAGSAVSAIITGGLFTRTATLRKAVPLSPVTSQLTL
jgi:hypothetical protein